MLYKVEAKFHTDLLAEFFTKLTDGSIQEQEPDGSTMLKAMKEAKITRGNTIGWYEVCYCATPFAHERKTVYDTYLYDFKTGVVAEVKDDISGESFWEHMKTV